VGPHQAKNLARKRGVSFFEGTVKSLLLKGGAEKRTRSPLGCQGFSFAEAGLLWSTRRMARQP
jgi:hypothetical protein